MNDTLETALKETWEKKDKFYEENKDLSILEILMKLENRYGARSASHNRTPLKQLGVPVNAFSACHPLEINVII